MADQIIVTIDGKECACEKGEYIFDVAARNGIEIPGYCRSDAFADHRACCRLCIVEVESRGRTQVVASCVYPIDGECEIRTHSERIDEDRAVLRALIRESEDDAFARLWDVDVDKCILCGLCVQACESLGTGAISLVNRGVEKEVNTPYSQPSLACVGCLSCANVCPKDAIPFTEADGVRSIWHREFELVACEKCGAAMGTAEALAYARERTLEPAAEGNICDACRKQMSADALKQYYRQA